ncbi:hypothetical protein Pla123a_45200 [Posidoniimonas polymericola]|uniref:Probable pectate lyase C n=2 Tax=Posidoniimonas polymericola TaxID=2528002 RepID=A0A5C5XZA8_9BACT|nr:hypothetical protein Pla123a_45200 [Posidoniimonas polymericola]
MAVLSVDNLNDSGAGSLRAAIDESNASPGADVILVAVEGTIELQSRLPVITDGLNLIGPGAELLTLDARGVLEPRSDPADRADASHFLVDDGDDTRESLVSISGIGMTGGSTSAVANFETLSLTGCDVFTIHDDVTSQGGVINYGFAAIAGCRFTSLLGVGVLNYGAASLSASSFERSLLGGRGSNAGPSIVNWGSGLVDNCEFLENSVLAIANRYGPGLLINNSRFVDNRQGAINNGMEAALEVVNCSFEANRGGSGNAIYNEGTAKVRASSFIGNVGGDGGAIHNAENRGYDVPGVLTISGCLFADNQASRGGALFDNGTTLITNSTFTSNTSAFNGAAIITHTTSDVEVVNCTFTDNGILSSSTFEIVGAIAPFGALTLINTVVAQTAGTKSIAGDVPVSGSNNLVEDGSDGLPDTIVADPLLGPLAFNGGPTLTHALLPGSPAINAGKLATTEPGYYDQRGAPYDRSVGFIDIGAYEAQGKVTAAPGDYNRDGRVNAADFTFWKSRAQPWPSTAPLNSADGDGDGQINQTDYQVWRSHYGFTYDLPAANTIVDPTGDGDAFVAVASPFAATQQATRPLSRPTARAMAPTQASHQASQQSQLLNTVRPRQAPQRISLATPQAPSDTGYDDDSKAGADEVFAAWGELL